MIENNKKYKTISEVAKILNLIDKKTGKLSTHTLRFWEKKFKIVKPHLFAGKRRYYDDKTVEILRKIQFLLKNKGMTIKGVIKQLQDSDSELDEKNNKSISTLKIKTKVNKISKIIKDLKNYGEKNTR